jgi:hypothetical protein
MPGMVPSIDRREQGRVFGMVVAGAFDDDEERQSGDQQRDAAVGPDRSECGREPSARAVARPSKRSRDFVTEMSLSAGARAPLPCQRVRVAAHSSRSAWTKAWGRLPRSWRWATSNSSLYRPAGPQAARLRSNQRAALTWSSCR